MPEPIYVVVETSGGVVQDVFHGDMVSSFVWDWDDFNDSDERALEMIRDADEVSNRDNPFLKPIITEAKKQLFERTAR